MSRREYRVALLHMRDHAAEAVKFVRGRSRSDLDSDRIFTLAMTKLVEIIGEASEIRCNQRRMEYIPATVG